MSKVRTLPAVAAALIAAGGVVWVIEHAEVPPTQREQRDDDRKIVAEMRTSGVATFAVIMRSGWRGTLVEWSHSVSKFDQVTEFVAAGEPVEVVVIGEQSAPDARRRISCRITVDGGEIDKNNIVVRIGETKTIKCQASV